MLFDAKSGDSLVKVEGTKNPNDPTQKFAAVLILTLTLITK